MLKCCLNFFDEWTRSPILDEREQPKGVDETHQYLLKEVGNIRITGIHTR